MDPERGSLLEVSGEEAVINEVHDEMKDSMEKAVKALHRDLQRIRTGRASLALLDGIMVDWLAQK